ncbi:hypothetical protein [Caballeronia sordidicola]|uniref:hypothetical protein n=1 Tax=Caballeronia sordidicola TaxID=196367 RepID=UPI000A803326|nr:hypothetical protein [Caballeronia sordidicola]
MKASTFDVLKVLASIPVHCCELHFTPTVEGGASKYSRYALIGRVTCASGGMAMAWLADGSAVKQSHALFRDYPDSDFDLAMEE